MKMYPRMWWLIFSLQVLGACCTRVTNEDKVAEIKTRRDMYLSTHKLDQAQTRYVDDPILEALIMDTAAYVTRTTEYLLNFQQSSASLRRNLGNDGPDYSTGKIGVLLQSLHGVLYTAGATEEQLQELGIEMFKQRTWYRTDYRRSEFTRCWTLIGQLIEYLNTDYLVPYSTRRPDFLYAAGEEFYYSYMTLTTYMSEQVEQAEVLRELSDIESKALALASTLGAPSSEIEIITGQLDDIFTTKFLDLNFAMGKFFSAALDAHSAILGVILRYNELMTHVI